MSSRSPTPLPIEEQLIDSVGGGIETPELGRRSTAILVAHKRAGRSPLGSENVSSSSSPMKWPTQSPEFSKPTSKSGSDQSLQPSSPSTEHASCSGYESPAAQGAREPASSGRLNLPCREGLSIHQGLHLVAPLILHAGRNPPGQSWRRGYLHPRTGGRVQFGVSSDDQHRGSRLPD